MNQLPEPELRPDPEEPRRYPSTVGGAVYIAVGLTAATGLGIIALGPWRSGLTLMGVAMLLGAVGRLVIADRNAGMLKVRRKSLDVAFMVLLGASLIALAVLVPDQPGVSRPRFPKGPWETSTPRRLQPAGSARKPGALGKPRAGPTR